MQSTVYCLLVLIQMLVQQLVGRDHASCYLFTHPRKIFARTKRPLALPDLAVSANKAAPKAPLARRQRRAQPLARPARRTPGHTARHADQGS